MRIGSAGGGNERGSAFEANAKGKSCRIPEFEGVGVAGFALGCVGGAGLSGHTNLFTPLF